MRIRVASIVVAGALACAVTVAGGAAIAEAQEQPTAPANSAQHEPPPEAKAFVQAYVAQMPKLDRGTVETIPPSAADPQIRRFDTPNIVAYLTDVKGDAPLLVWFSGTGGTPYAGWLFIKAAADAGYRVIGLTYDNGVSDPQTCGPNPDAACSDRFRQKRIFGDDVSKDIDDLPAESVVNRLTKLLQYLDTHEPGKGWSQYLSNGEPNWPHIAVAGHSQGGGVAAYIAKKKLVYRVINLSGAWDRTEQGSKDWAPWITSPSATPMDRWYCAYHAKESNAAPMKAAYAVMNVPPDHIRVLTLELNLAYFKTHDETGGPGTAIAMVAPQIMTLDPNAPKPDYYHGSMISMYSTPRDSNGAPAYAADWAFMLGNPK